MINFKLFKLLIMKDKHDDDDEDKLMSIILFCRCFKLFPLISLHLFYTLFINSNSSLDMVQLFSLIDHRHFFLITTTTTIILIIIFISTLFCTYLRKLNNFPLQLYPSWWWLLTCLQGAKSIEYYSRSLWMDEKGIHEFLSLFIFFFLLIIIIVIINNNKSIIIVWETCTWLARCWIFLLHFSCSECVLCQRTWQNFLIPLFFQASFFHLVCWYIVSLTDWMWKIVPKQSDFRFSH